MSNSLVITSWTEASVSASGTAAEVVAIANQKVVRLYPLTSGQVFFGFTASVTTSTGEPVANPKGVTIMTDKSVWIITTGSTIVTRCMKGQ